MAHIAPLWNHAALFCFGEEVAVLKGELSDKTHCTWEKRVRPRIFLRKALQWSAFFLLVLTGNKGLFDLYIIPK